MITKILVNEIITDIYNNGIRPLIEEKETYAYIKDPILHINRNRVVAEVLKALINSGIEKDEKIIEKFSNFLIKNQNTDGSWNELHPNYNQPSALITSIIGEALLLNIKKNSYNDFEKSIQLAKDYVLTQEKSNGYFLKSKENTADHLNVDATCGAFLAGYGKFFSDEHCINVARRVAKHVCDYQFSNGSYPYTIDKGNYVYIFNIPCIHYQGVTIYYLSKINEVINEEWLKNSLIMGTRWLSGVQKRNGEFDWSKSGLMFAYYLTGAYAFAFSSFIYLSKLENKYLANAKQCLDLLKKNTKGLILRWEKNPSEPFFLSIPVCFKTASIGDYPFRHKLFRLGYGLYRQKARRRLSMNPDDKLAKNITKILNLKTTTIEPFHNYPDMFMTSEVIDCLSNSLSFLTENES
jgi:hypothetical protein